MRLRVASLLLLTVAVVQAITRLKCTSHSEQTVMLPVHGPADQFVLSSNSPQSRFLDQYNSKHYKCKWSFTPYHGSRIEVRYSRAEFFKTSHCSGSVLRIYNEAKTSVVSSLNYPGYNASCGLNFFPDKIASDGPMFLEIETTNPDDISYYVTIVGTNPTECPERSSSWKCPTGPCCKGYNCCSLELGTDTVDIDTSALDKSNQDCSWNLVTRPGSQILVNFREMDMISSSISTECAQQSVTLEEQDTSHSKLLGHRDTFCGKQVPNYPGPSAITSLSNKIKVTYKTDGEKVIRGRGFKAAVSAINPLCAPIKIFMDYQTSKCEHTCGLNIQQPPPTYPTPECPDPVLKIMVKEDNKAQVPIGGATVTITTQNSGRVSRTRTVKRTTLMSGLVQDSRFVHELIKITAHAPGFEAVTKEFNFTCETGKCNKCIWMEVILLPPTKPNTTFCPDVKAKVVFVDFTTKRPIPDVIFDVYRLDLTCPLPGGTITASVLASKKTNEIEKVQSNKSDKSKSPKESNRDADKPCTMKRVVSNLVTDYDGRATFLVESSAHYLVREVRHKAYLDPSSLSVGTVNCSLPKCDSCRLQLRVNLTQPSCTSAKLSVHVRDKDSDEGVLGAKVDVFQGDNKLTREPLVTDATGKVVLDVADKGTYRVNVSAEGMTALEKTAATHCDPTNCTTCRTVLEFQTARLPTPAPCPTSSLSLTVLDITTRNTPADLTISVFYSPFPACDLERDIDYVGTDFRIYGIHTPEECRLKCRSQTNCFYFTYSKKELSCRVFTSIFSKLPFKENPPIVSGQAYCPWGEESPVVRCKTTRNTCCTAVMPCGPGEGHCTADSACAGDLICGQNNCDKSVLGKNNNCCEKPSGMLLDYKVADKVSSLQNHVIDQNGIYSIKISAPTYESQYKVVRFNCSVGKCENCSQEYSINLKQEFCKETHFDITVTDKGQPVKGAMVTLFQPKDTPVAVQTTSSKGRVSFPILGRANYVVNIKKAGYVAFSKETKVFCKPGVQCSECKPSLEVELTEEFCNKPVKLFVQALDKLGEPIKNAKTKLTLKKTEVGYQDKSISRGRNDASGMYEELITQFGIYTVQVTAEGFLSNTKDVKVENTTTCMDLTIPVTLEPQPTPFCPKANIRVNVTDLLTMVTVPGSSVVIRFKGKVQANTTTDSDGVVKMDVKANGIYQVTVSKKGYLTKDITFTLKCDLEHCEECHGEWVVPLDQPRCKDVIFPVYVTDYHVHEKPINNALVELYLLSTLSGQSNSLIASRRTDDKGTAIFRVQMNGKYLVKIKAAGYIDNDGMLNMNCSEYHCSACNPVLKPQLKQQFCENKNMTLLVKNAVKNVGVEGATVKIWIRLNYLRDGISSYKTDKSGRVSIPLKANGQYNVEISHSSYLTLQRKFQINVQPGSCDAFHPVDLSPLSPPLPCARGTRVSLSWDRIPKDLDLYSYRVHNNDTNNKCLTYYCDGKDPCSGTSHDIDNKKGGLNGSETITYCNKEDFVNMIYVDDASGHGAYLASSKAKLVLQAASQSIVVHLNVKASYGKRYWLAGCLLLEKGAFTFLEVSEFFDIPPNVGQPHFCYNEIKLRRLAESGKSADGAGLNVMVQAEDWGLSGATVELKKPSGLSHYQSTNNNGLAMFSILQNGEYLVMVRKSMYYPALVPVKVTCVPGTVRCNHHVKVQLSKIRVDGAIRLNLAWGARNSNLNLHTIQIDSEKTGSHCETFYNQPATCSKAEFGQEGMGEAITLLDAARKPSLTYLVFVEDGSSAANLNMSRTRISISDGLTETIHLMPGHRAFSGDKFWFAGCLGVQGDSYRFIAVDKFSHTSPLNSDRLACVGLLKSKSTTSGVPAFCPNVRLRVNVVNSFNNRPLNTRLDVVRMQGEDQESIYVPLQRYGKTEIPLAANGIYHIEAKSGGYAVARSEVVVDCKPNRCNACQPQVVVPMTSYLRPGTARLAVSWGKELDDVDLYVIQRSLTGRGETCVAKHGKNNRANCGGVIPRVVSHGSSDQARFESMDLAGGKAGEVKYYMVVVALHYHSHTKKEAHEIGSEREVCLTITDKEKEEVRVKMNNRTYNKDKYWIAGCLGGEYMVSSSFTEINLFKDSPPENGHNYCKDFIQAGLNNCFSGTRGPSYSVANAGKLLETQTKDSVKKCADHCTKLPKCQAWQWNPDKNITSSPCLLYSSGKLSGKLKDGSRSYAAICPKKSTKPATIPHIVIVGKTKVSRHRMKIKSKGKLYMSKRGGGRRGRKRYGVKENKQKRNKATGPNKKKNKNKNVKRHRRQRKRKNRKQIKRYGGHGHGR